MNLSEYQKAAAKTAIYPASVTVKYPVFGLCGEAGEIMEKLKRHYRKGEPIDPKPLALELGDVLWYVAMIALDCGYDLGQLYAAAPIMNSLDNAVVYLYQSAATLATEYIWGLTLERRTIKKVLTNVSTTAHLLGYSIHDIADMNIAKLADRQKREVLHGEGDNR